MPDFPPLATTAAAAAEGLPRPWARGALPLGAALCLVLGLGEGLMAVLGGLIREDAVLVPAVAAGQLAGTGLLRAATVALMLLLALGAQRWLGRPVRYAAALGVAVLLGTVLSWAVFDVAACPAAQAFGYAQRLPVCQGATPVHDWTGIYLARQAQIALLVVALVSWLAIGRHAAQALQRSTLQALALQREQAASQAQLLQSQIEPHFLFNTLGNLRRLLQTDRAAGIAMLADLQRYLQQALPRLRGPGARLVDEMALVRAYLELHAVRMGPRLQYAIELPEPLQQAEVPPLLLLTLVENAIKHGLQALPEGGRIEVGARAAAGGLQLTVRDNGRGMGTGIGHGMGLANLRNRLQALYGPRASLSLQLGEPRGLCAVVTLPRATA